MATTEHLSHLIELRRDLHRHPEPAWREYYTTARIVEELERLGVDEIHLGPEGIATEERASVPEDPAELDRWADRAREAGADPDLVDALREGHTGVVAVIDRGDGPHVGLRVDIDALFREESADESHRPAAEGFRSTTGETMHACGHDAHTTMGIGVIERILASDFTGRLTVGFQPAEEEAGGGKALARGGHFDDIDYLFSVHVGLGHPSGEVVAGIDGFLAVANVEVDLFGEAAHAGARPEEGRNAIQAAAAAIEGLYGIARHNDGITRVNVGTIEGGSATNIIAEHVRFQGEVRGETTELREYVKQRANTVIESAAAMHDCTAELRYGPEAPSGASDPALADVVESVASTVDGVETILPRDRLGGSEDATYIMEHVQERGGLAAYVGIGTDHPGGHHTATFDVDEASIRIGIDVLAGAIERVAADGV